jgi:hypothetical protein
MRFLKTLLGLTAFTSTIVLPEGRSTAAPALPFEQSAAAVDVNEFVEVTVRPDAAPSGNPFDPGIFTGEIFEPGGRKLAVEGFCDNADGRVFRIRFLATKPGLHRYRLRFREGAKARQAEGRFEARPSKRRGIVRVDPKHPFHFIYQGTGEHYFWNGVTAYFLLGFRDDAAIAGIIDRHARLGVTRLRVALSGRSSGARTWAEDLTPDAGFRLTLNPWVAARPDAVENPGFDVTRFDPGFFHKAERMLLRARDKDVAISVIFFLDGKKHGGADPFGRKGAGGPDEQRYYRYVVARFAAYSNVMWDLSNEYRHFRDDAWASAMGAFVKRVDPWDHLLSVHGHWEFFLRRDPSIDMALYQQWDDCGDNVYMLHNRQVQTALGKPMPQINEEYGYEDHYPGFGCGDNGVRQPPGRDAGTRRRLLWRITMAGGYQTTGEKVGPGKTGIANAGGWINGRGVDDTLLTQHKHLVDFFATMPWWKMQPRLDRTSHGALALVEEGAHVVVYGARPPAGGDVQAQLGKGRWRGRWLEPATGKTTPIAELDGPLFTGTPPGAEDWAAHLERVR